MPFSIKYSPKLLIGILVTIFFGIALFIRIYFPFDEVFVGDWIKYTGNDAYYQIRLAENMAFNFPNITAFDPYLIFPGGATYGGIHFFNSLLAFVIWVLTLGSPTAHAVDIIGVYFPVVLAALTVIPAYFMGKALFNRWAGVIAAGLMAVLPGEFVGRSILGGTDQHVAETLFSAAAAMFVIFAVRSGWLKQLSWDHIVKRNWKTFLPPLLYSLLGGLFLGIYLLTWIGSLLFVFIITVYFIIQFIVDRFKGQSSFYLGFTGFFIFLVAFILYRPAVGNTSFQSLALITAMLIPPALAAISGLMAKWKLKGYYYPAALAVIAVLFIVIFNALNPAMLDTMLGQFVIFSPGGPTGTTTIEMQPFLSPQGTFSTQVAWGNFTTSFFIVPWWPIPGIGIIALIILIVLYIKRRSDEKHMLFFFVWTLIMLIATLTQRRFAYYLVVNIALLSAYLAWQFIRLAATWRSNKESPDTLEVQYKRSRFIGIIGGIIIYLSCITLGNTLYFLIPALIMASLSLFYGFWAWVKLKNQNEYMILWAFLFPIGVLVLAFSADNSAKSKTAKKTPGALNPWLYRLNIATLIALVFIALFWPNYNKSRDIASQATYAASDAWEETMHWLRENTPEPLGPDSYYGLYDRTYEYPESAYGVTAWWDYGYWIMRTARRLPSANPSQSAGPVTKVANLFLSQDEEQAGEIVSELDSSYIILDYTITTTKLWAVATWAGIDPERYTDTYYVVDQNQLVPIQVFTPEYYKLLAVRLYNFDGKGSAGEKPIVITYEDKVSSTGVPYKQVADAQEFDSYLAAQSFIESQQSGKHVLVGSTPLLNPIPVEPVTDYRLVYSSTLNNEITQSQGISEVKVFEHAGD